MRITSTVPDLRTADIRRMLNGLPAARGYRLEVKPLRYRTRPHLSGLTDFATKTITLQVPEPFHPFGEVVPYGAKRRPGRGLKFVWLTEGITFRARRDVLRFLYCHEWMHVFAISGQAGRRVGEMTCDRFALLNYRRPIVTIEDAKRALDWRSARGR